MRGPERLPGTEAGWSVHKNMRRGRRSRPVTSRGRGRPETEDMHARKCPRPEAKVHLRACMSEAECRSRPRQA
eukprot:363243-Chlamydomonas_euryale.AAC.10